MNALEIMFRIFIVLIQAAGLISLIAVVVLLVMAKHGYEINAKDTEEEDSEWDEQ